MIGEGPEKKMAENLCKKLNIESKVIFWVILMKLKKIFVIQIFSYCHPALKFWSCCFGSNGK